MVLVEDAVSVMEKLSIVVAVVLVDVAVVLADAAAEVDVSVVVPVDLRARPRGYPFWGNENREDLL